MCCYSLIIAMMSLLGGGGAGGGGKSRDFLEFLFWNKHILFNRHKIYTEYIYCKHAKD